MKKIILLSLLVVFAFGSSAVGQSSQPHPSGLVTWSATADATAIPTLVYHVYRADVTAVSNCTPATTGFVLVNTTAVGATSYLDTGVSATKTYCWAVREFANGKEGPIGTPAGAEIPLSSVAPSVSAN